ncbi:hypothetical protein KZC51_02930 [Microbacterium sp. SSW1-49]|uniref:CU044_5270 family protein n=1 Tax=Microbacterium croceum TaxID=2851645 RepID=A0ABT0FAH9_9MICO|nr:hypothetical protein [Microbacterium croceum]MCK2035080.1 hypothetical protein [Microbacterium croceum]
MNISVDELDRLFRAAHPAPQQNTTGLSAAHIAIRESIIRGTGRPRPQRARRTLLWTGLTTAVATAAAAVVIAVNVLSPTGQAVALTPPPLEYRASGSLAQVVDDAEQALLAPPDVAQESRVRSVSWGWSVEMEAGHVEVVPQDITFVWAPGETATSTIVAGDSYWSDAERPADVEPSEYQPGDLIDEVVIPPEDFTLPAAAATLSGSAPEDLEPALAVFGATPESSSGELLAAIAGLMQYWTLSDAQHATLLRMLVDAGGVQVLGETTDRLGRDVIGLRVASTIPERVETVFVSVETGRLAGTESELIEPLDTLPVGVISYTMWDAGH